MSDNLRRYGDLLRLYDRGQLLDKDAKDEKARYLRFLGRDVEYTKLSFERIAADPMAIIGP